MFFLHFSIILRRWFDDQDFIVAFNFFQCLRNLENMAKCFLQALSISKKHNIIAFLSLEGSEENGVDGQLLHAIKAFYGADWSFVVESIAGNRCFPYKHELRQECNLFPLFFIVYMNWIDKCNQADEFATIGN